MAFPLNTSYQTFQDVLSARDGASSSNVRLSDTYRSTFQLGTNQSTVGATQRTMDVNHRSSVKSPTKNTNYRTSNQSVKNYGGQTSNDVHQSYLNTSTRLYTNKPRKIQKSHSTSLFSQPSTNLAAAVTRKSYQDSNIFGTKDSTNQTVQASARENYYKRTQISQPQTQMNIYTKNVAPTVAINLLNPRKKQDMDCQNQTERVMNNQSGDKLLLFSEQAIKMPPQSSRVQSPLKENKQFQLKRALSALNVQEGRQVQKTSYNDGKKIYLTGCSTRNEKNWKSQIFDKGDSRPNNRKSVAKVEAEAKRLLQLDVEIQYQKRTKVLNFQQNRAKSSADFMFDRSYDASKKANQQFYGAKADQYQNTSKFKIEEMISPNADWANPRHQPLRNSKNQSRSNQIQWQGRKSNAHESNVQRTVKADNPSVNQYHQKGKNGGYFDQRNEGIQSQNQGEKLFPASGWQSKVAVQTPNNVKGKISAYDRKQKDMKGNDVLEKTDYSGYVQLRPNKVDVGKYQRKMVGSNQHYSDIGIGSSQTNQSVLNSSKQSTDMTVGGSGANFHRKVSSDLQFANANVFDQHSATSALMRKRHSHLGAPQPQSDLARFRHSNEIKGYGFIDQSMQNDIGKRESEDVRNGVKEWHTAKVGGLQTSMSNYYENSTKKIHQYFLSSKMPDGRSSMAAYGQGQQAAENVRLLDLDLHDIPAGADEISLKKIIGASHIIKAEIDQNNINGANTGRGRVQIRLREGQQQRELQDRLSQAGMSSSRRLIDSKKNNDFSENQYETKERKKWTKVQQQQASYPLNKKTNTKSKKQAEISGQFKRLDHPTVKQIWR